MQSDVIALGKNFVEGIYRFDAVFQRQRVLDGEIDVIAVNGHAERERAVGDEDADGAQSDHPQLFSENFPAGKRLFALLHRRRNVFRYRLYPIHAVDDVAAAKQQRCEDQLLDAVCVCARRIEHDDAPLRKVVRRDVVYPRARTRDGDEIFPHGGAVQRGAAHQNGVRLRQVVREAVILPERGKSARSDFVHTFHFIRHVFPLRVPFQIFP